MRWPCFSDHMHSVDVNLGIMEFYDVILLRMCELYNFLLDSSSVLMMMECFVSSRTVIIVVVIFAQNLGLLANCKDH